MPNKILYVDTAIELHRKMWLEIAANPKVAKEYTETLCRAELIYGDLMLDCFACSMFKIRNIFAWNSPCRDFGCLFVWKETIQAADYWAADSCMISYYGDFEQAYADERWGEAAKLALQIANLPVNMKLYHKLVGGF